MLIKNDELILLIIAEASLGKLMKSWILILTCPIWELIPSNQWSINGLLKDVELLWTQWRIRTKTDKFYALDVFITSEVFVLMLLKFVYYWC